MDVADQRTTGPGERLPGGTGTQQPADHLVRERRPAEGQTAELAEKLGMLAATDPVLARALMAELVSTLNQATAGAFGKHLSPAERAALGLTEDADLEVLEAAWAAASAGATVGTSGGATVGASDGASGEVWGGVSGCASGGVDGGGNGVDERRWEPGGDADST